MKILQFITVIKRFTEKTPECNILTTLLHSTNIYSGRVMLVLVPIQYKLNKVNLQNTFNEKYVR